MTITLIHVAAASVAAISLGGLIVGLFLWLRSDLHGLGDSLNGWGRCPSRW